MNPEVKAKWLAALRGGEYQQAQHRLRDPSHDAYCCLGVLCDLYRKETGEGEWDGNAFRHYHQARRICEYGSLPVVVMKWAGLSECDPRIKLVGGAKDSLGALNDTHDYTFNEIANVIEEQL